ncbi:MAG: hypothetical protein PVF22_00420 [Candidatus Aminicenantes bacterium]|jgi:hypothetical protein
MNVFRKILGLLLLVFIGLPLLFGIIWAVGITKTAVSPEFVTRLPQEIIADIPSIVEEVFEEAQDEDVIADPNTRAWFEAAAKVDISPKELMERIGLLDWMDYELSDLLEDIEGILTGRRRARTLIFDLRSLKDALTHEEFFLYLEEVMDNLPPCDYAEQRRWERSTWRGIDWFSRPPCRPDRETYELILEDIRDEVEFEIPNDIEIFEGMRFVPFGISRAVTWLSYFLFLLPAAVIFLAALIAATSPASFFRWSGISTLVGGLSALLFTLFTRQVVRWAIHFRPYSDAWSADLQNLIADKTEWIQLAVIDHLFIPVVTIAGVVCGVGVVLFAISLIVSSRGRTEYRPQPPQTPPKTAPPAMPEPEKDKPEEPESPSPSKKEQEKT